MITRQFQLGQRVLYHDRYITEICFDDLSKKYYGYVLQVIESSFIKIGDWMMDPEILVKSDCKILPNQHKSK